MTKNWHFYLTLFFLPLLALCLMGSYYHGPISDHFNGAHFFNPDGGPKRGTLPYLRMELISKRPSWPSHINNSFADVPPTQVLGNDLRVSYVGHSTVLIQTQGVNIVTDPIWSSYAGPTHLFSIQRISDPGISFDQLPKIDLVVISHNHYDHLDIPTLQKIWDRDQPLIVVPLGTDTVIKRDGKGIKSTALDWHQFVKLNNDVTVYLEPSQHWSRRTITDENESLWSSYVIDTPGGKIFFAGDTGYGQGTHFRYMRAKHGEFRFALLPIGSYKPRWFMEYYHMDPEEAVLAHQDLGSPTSLAIHFDTFHQGDENFNEAPHDLEIAKNHYQVSPQQLRALKPGQAWTM